MTSRSARLLAIKWLRTRVPAPASRATRPTSLGRAWSLIAAPVAPSGIGRCMTSTVASLAKSVNAWELPF